MSGISQIDDTDKIVELHLKEGAGKMIIVESIGGNEVMTQHDLMGKNKITIELQNEESILVIKKQEML